MYVNVETERGDEAELVMETDRDQEPFIALNFNTKEGEELAVFLVMQAEVPNFFEAVEKLKAEWDRVGG